MIESLEARIAPAGVVEILVQNGTLILKTLTTGDGDENLTITSTGPGAFTIDPDAATTLRVNGANLAIGDPTNLTGIFGSIGIALGAGNDTVDFTGNVGGKFVADLGEGNDTLTIHEGSIAGDMLINGGAGNDTVKSLPVSGGALFIGGKFAATLGEGNNTLALGTTTTVTKDLLVSSGSGNDSLRLDGGNSFHIGGNLTLLSGKGNDSLAVNLGDTFSVGKNVTFNSLGGGTTVSQTIAASRGITIGGKVTFTGQPKSTLTQSIGSSALSVNIGGGVTFTGTSYTTEQSLSAGTTLTIGGAVKMANKVPIVVFASLPEQAIALPTAEQSITTGIVASTSPSSIKGPITLTGADTVKIAVLGELRGAVSIKTAAIQTPAVVTLGANDANFTSRFLGAVKITFGKDNLSTESANLFSSFFAGMVNVTGSEGDTTFTVRDSTFAKAVTFLGNAGADTVNWETASLSGQTGRAFGPVKLVGGIGADTFNISSAMAADTALFLGAVTFDGGKDADTDTITKGSSATFFFTPKQINFP